MALKNLKLGDVLALEGDRKIRCRILNVFREGIVVEVFGAETPEGALRESSPVAVMCVDGVQLMRDFVRIARLSPADRWPPDFEFGQPVVFQTDGLARASRGEALPGVLRFIEPPVDRTTGQPLEREWYFVMQRSPDDAPEDPRRFQIQLLNLDGTGKAWGHVSVDDDALIIGEHPVPIAVIRAAQSRQVGHGEYVGANGEILDFLGRPVRLNPEGRER